MIAVLIKFIDLFVTVFNILILIRVVMSWVMPHHQNRFAQLVFELTEPILAPVRRILPKSELIDISPIVVFFLLQLLQRGANYLLLSL